ncbi:MAG: redoxin family protein [Bacteroidaceae bacterium]|nr:redoxin family protein [Bacteroidaceae bacterium]
MKNICFILLATMLFACGNNNSKSEAQQAPAEVAKTEAQPVVYENNYLVKVGDMAPDFTLKLADGNEFTLSKNRGKIVMLQFTASWCGVCRKEMPFIEKDIWQRHKDNSDFVLVGIDREEPLETVMKFAESTGVTYPLALDTNADVFASYAERKAGITRNILIDKDGRSVMLTRLFNEDEFNALVQKIDAMLAK